MEERRGADEIGAALQGDTALGLGILQLFDAGEVPVDQHRVGVWPQVLRWLQLRGIGWLRSTTVRHDTVSEE
jgi:hypothetical protein